MVKGRLDINYFEKELPATPVPYNTRNVIALISEYEEVISPVEIAVKIIDKAIEVAQNSTDDNAAADVAAITDIPAKIVTAVDSLTTITEVVQAIEAIRDEIIEDASKEPMVIQPVEWSYERFRNLRDANIALNCGLDEDESIVIPQTPPTAKGNLLIDKMYSVRSDVQTILLINKAKLTTLAEQLETIAKSSTSLIVKDSEWKQDELDIFSIFAKEEKAKMNGVGIVGALDLSDTNFNTITKARTNFMNKFAEGGIIFMATSPIVANGSNYSLNGTNFTDGMNEITFDMDEVAAFWAAYISGLTENQSLSRQIVTPINKNTLSTDEFYKAKGVSGADSICLQCGLISIAQRDIITEQFEVLNSNTPKYYKKLNDYLDMSIIRTQNLIMNEVREGLRRLQGKKNKPVSYSAVKSLIEFLVTIYVPDYLDSLTVTAAKNGSTKVISTIESDYTNIIGTIDVYGYNNIN